MLPPVQLEDSLRFSTHTRPDIEMPPRPARNSPLGLGTPEPPFRVLCLFVLDPRDRPLVYRLGVSICRLESDFAR